MDVNSTHVEEINATPVVEMMNDITSVENANANNGYKEYENEIDTSDEEVRPLFILFRF